MPEEEFKSQVDSDEEIEEEEEELDEDEGILMKREDEEDKLIFDVGQELKDGQRPQVIKPELDKNSG